MLFALVLATLAADTNTPLLVRYHDSGFTLPGMARAEHCAIFADHVLIRRSLAGEVQTEETHPITLQGNFAGLMARAADGEQTVDIGPTDAPQLHYYAVRMVHGQAQQIDLGSRVDTRITHNAAAEAVGLKNFLDSHCPPM